MASGVAAAESRSISRDLEMSQFWQNRHARLQPAVPKDSTALPGRKWLSGFFHSPRRVGPGAEDQNLAAERSASA
jgi:hypothetical protein